MNARAGRWVVVVTALITGTAAFDALAQSSKTKSKTRPSSSSNANPNVKQLDVRAMEMQERLLRDASDIAKGYEDAGEFDRARWLLEVLEKLDPKLPGLKDKIEQLTDKSLDSTEFEVELDVSKGWTPGVGVVQEGRIVRIEATGEYKLNLSAPTTADGLTVSDSGADLVGGIPVGALIGVVVDPKSKKPSKPFEIKAKREWTPRESGFLQLKVNLPSGHKASGKLTIRIGGVAQLPN